MSAATDGLHILSKRTGELLQFFDPGQGATARAAALGDSVYILSNAGAFFALSSLLVCTPLVKTRFSFAGRRAAASYGMAQR